MAYTIGMAVEFESPREEPRYVWRDYLTPVVGLVVIIAIVIGVFSAIRGLTGRKTQEVATESEVAEGQGVLPEEEAGVPESEINLGAVTQNSQYSQAQPTSVPAPATELPKTGFPGAVVAALSAILAGVGLKLRKIRKI